MHYIALRISKSLFLDQTDFPNWCKFLQLYIDSNEKPEQISYELML